VDFIELEYAYSSIYVQTMFNIREIIDRFGLVVQAGRTILHAYLYGQVKVMGRCFFFETYQS